MDTKQLNFPIGQYVLLATGQDPNTIYGGKWENKNDNPDQPTINSPVVTYLDFRGTAYDFYFYFPKLDNYSFFLPSFDITTGNQNLTQKFHRRFFFNQYTNNLTFVDDTDNTDIFFESSGGTKYPISDNLKVEISSDPHKGRLHIYNYNSNRLWYRIILYINMPISEFKYVSYTGAITDYTPRSTFPSDTEYKYLATNPAGTVMWKKTANS